MIPIQRKIQIFSALLLLTILGLCAFKSQLIKAIVIKSATQTLGAKVQIDQISFSIFKRKIELKGLKVYNPPGFPDETMLDIPDVLVSNYDLPALLRGKIHLNIVRINLREAVIIRGKDKKLNVDSLKVVEQNKKGQNPLPPGKEKFKTHPLQIEHLTMNIGRVIFKDFSVVGPPTVQVFDVGIKNKVFLNIKSVEALAAVVLVEALRPTAIRNAAVYGVASLLGVAFLPAGIAAVLMGQDDAQTVVPMALEKLYSETAKFLKTIGRVTSDNRGLRTIKLAISGNSVTVKFDPRGEQTNILVTARKYLLPKPQVAGGVLYQILQALNVQPVRPH